MYYIYIYIYTHIYMWRRTPHQGSVDRGVQTPH